MSSKPSDAHRRAGWKSSLPNWTRKQTPTSSSSSLISQQPSLGSQSSNLRPDPPTQAAKTQVAPSSNNYRQTQTSVQAALAIGSHSATNSQHALRPAIASTNIALRRAIETHALKLSESEKAAFLGGSSINPTILLGRVRDLDQQQKQKSKYRPYVESVGNFLHLLDRSIGGVAIAIQANPDVSSIAVGGAKFIIDLALQFVTYLDDLMEMLDKISDYLPLLDKYAEHSDRPIICEALSGVYLDILDFYSAALEVYADRTGHLKRFVSPKLFIRAQWRPFKAKFGVIQSNLSHHHSLLLQSGVVEVLGVHQQNQTRQLEQDKEELLTWLSNHNFHFKQNSTFEACYENTGHWIVQTNGFKTWIAARESKMVWCHGKPGSGKSVLASQVIKHLEGLQSVEADQTGLCFAYFSLDDASFRSAESLILALAEQLCRKRTQLPEWLSKGRKHNRDPLILATLSNFIELNSCYQKTYVVLDGLDECPERDRRPILEFINSIRQVTPVFKVFVTSREEVDIADHFGCAEVIQLSTNSQGSSADIDYFIRQESSRLRQNKTGRKLAVRSDRVFNEIVSTLTQNADGMFLWVVLQLDYLCSLKSDSTIQAALKEIPADLNETYARILMNIARKDGHQRRIAVTCFRWLLTAERTLNWAELEASLALTDPNSQTFKDALTDMPPESYILSACGNLICLAGRRRWWAGGPVTFIHSSVFQFFSSNFQSLGIAIDPWSCLVDKQTLQISNALDCISYIRLLIDDLDAESDLQEQVEFSPFAHYAFNFFDKHAVASVRTADTPSALMSALETILNRDEDFLFKFLALRMLLKPDPAAGFSEMNHEYERPVDRDRIIWSTELYKLYHDSLSLLPPDNTVHLIAAKGILEQLEDLIPFIEHGWLDINENDQSGYSALYYACANGHVLFADILLRNGALCQAHGERGPYHSSAEWLRNDTPLCAAVRNGHIQIVERLLKAGADVNVLVDSFGTLNFPLEISKHIKDETMTQFLLANGADSRLLDSKTLDATEGAVRQ